MFTFKYWGPAFSMILEVLGPELSFEMFVKVTMFTLEWVITSNQIYIKFPVEFWGFRYVVVKCVLKKS